MTPTVVPLWFTITQAVALVVIAVIGVGIAYRQWRTAREKLRNWHQSMERHGEQWLQGMRQVERSYDELRQVMAPYMSFSEIQATTTRTRWRSELAQLWERVRRLPNSWRGQPLE